MLTVVSFNDWQLTISVYYLLKDDKILVISNPKMHGYLRIFLFVDQ